MIGKKWIIFWEKHGYITVIGICVLVILILAIFRIGKKGTFARSLINPISLFDIEQRKVSSPPKDSSSNLPKDSKGELECRRVLERYFNKPFPKARPDFLKNPVTGGYYNLELDCFNSELRLAVEYDGIQHYKYVPYFHKNKEAFLNQKYRDEMKKRGCMDNGINLIIVPYTVKVEDIQDYLTTELRNKKY